MASGTKHFMYNQAEDWRRMGLAEGLTVREDALVLTGSGRGMYTSWMLDTLERETVWHRLRIQSSLPANAQLRLYLYCSDDDQIPSSFRAEGLQEQTVNEWLSAASPQERERFFRTCATGVYDEPRDLPLYGFQGRYLWFCLTFDNYDREDMVVESIRLEFPRVAFIDYLPQIYRGADSINSFFARFISVFQAPYVDLEDDIDQMPRRCDPAVAPPEFLRWLADCLAVTDQSLWSEERLRVFLQNAVRLYRIKGTKLALRQAIELYTGKTPLIIEQFQPAACQVWRRDGATLRRLYGSSRYTVTILMPDARGGPDDYAKLWKIIEAFRSVDAICNLVFMNDEIILGQHCYLGMNSRIGSSKGLVLDGAAAASAPYLAEFATGGTRDEQSAI